MNNKLNEKLLDGNQPRLMNGDGSEIRKVQSKHVELLDEISLEEVPEEKLEQGTNPHINTKATNGGKSIFDYNPNENIFSI